MGTVPVNIIQHSLMCYKTGSHGDRSAGDSFKGTAHAYYCKDSLHVQLLSEHLQVGILPENSQRVKSREAVPER